METLIKILLMVVVGGLLFGALQAIDPHDYWLTGIETCVVLGIIARSLWTYE